MTLRFVVEVSWLGDDERPDNFKVADSIFNVLMEAEGPAADTLAALPLSIDGCEPVGG